MNKFRRSRENGKIIKFDRNKLFKGHTGELRSYSNDELILTNSYYSGCIINKYIVKDNITETTAYIQNAMPKWFFNKIKKAFWGTNSNVIKPLKYSNEFYDVIAAYDHLQLCASYQDEGISFSNHYDNITELKKLQKDLSLFIKTIKKTRIDDIVNSTKDSYCLDKDFMEKYSQIS